LATVFFIEVMMPSVCRVGQVRSHWTKMGGLPQTARMTTIAGGTQSGPDAEPENDDLTELRRRRAELLESIRDLEQALAAPVPGRQMRWVERVSAALLELSGDFHDHVELTEGPTGLYGRVIRTSPRLAHVVERLTHEHKTLTELIADLLSLVGKTAGSFARGDSIVADLEEVRERGTALIAALVRHRQRGADLVYEGYSVDIGGQD
jgi:hypothetical protein